MRTLRLPLTAESDIRVCLHYQTKILTLHPWKIKMIKKILRAIWAFRPMIVIFAPSLLLWLGLEVLWNTPIPTAIPELFGVGQKSIYGDSISKKNLEDMALGARQWLIILHYNFPPEDDYTVRSYPAPCKQRMLQKFVTDQAGGCYRSSSGHSSSLSRLASDWDER